MAKATINLVKAEYKHVDITRYYVSINGGSLKEVSADTYSRYFKQGIVITQGSEEYQDRFMFYREMQIL